MEKLEQLLGLHERLEVLYVVDGYQVTLLSMDGAKIVTQVKADSLEQALQAIALGTPGKDTWPNFWIDNPNY